MDEMLLSRAAVAQRVQTQVAQHKEELRGVHLVRPPVPALNKHCPPDCAAPPFRCARRGPCGRPPTRAPDGLRAPAARRPAQALGEHRQLVADAQWQRLVVAQEREQYRAALEELNAAAEAPAALAYLAGSFAADGAAAEAHVAVARELHATAVEEDLGWAWERQARGIADSWRRDALITSCHAERSRAELAEAQATLAAASAAARVRHDAYAAQKGALRRMVKEANHSRLQTRFELFRWQAAP
jgi:hypothetical protein